MIKIPFAIQQQPTDESCGPTCLQAVYDYLEDPLDLSTVLREVPMLSAGGTLAVMLGNHALQRGFEVTLYTYNLQMFDPTWFVPGVDLAYKLRSQLLVKESKRLKEATQAYLEFLGWGGKIQFEELTPDLIQKHLEAESPIITGLSSTYLYQNARELPDTNESHDVRGLPVGHFVVLYGFNPATQMVSVADPYPAHNLGQKLYYTVPVHRVINSILLGIVTFDANLLIVHPKN